MNGKREVFSLTVVHGGAGILAAQKMLTPPYVDQDGLLVFVAKNTGDEAKGELAVNAPERTFKFLWDEGTPPFSWPPETGEVWLQQPNGTRVLLQMG